MSNHFQISTQNRIFKCLKCVARKFGRLSYYKCVCLCLNECIRMRAFSENSKRNGDSDIYNCIKLNFHL